MISPADSRKPRAVQYVKERYEVVLSPEISCAAQRADGLSGRASQQHSHERLPELPFGFLCGACLSGGSSVVCLPPQPLAASEALCSCPLGPARSCTACLGPPVLSACPHSLWQPQRPYGPLCCCCWCWAPLLGSSGLPRPSVLLMLLLGGAGLLRPAQALCAAAAGAGPLCWAPQACSGPLCCCWALTAAADLGRPPTACASLCWG